MSELAILQAVRLKGRVDAETVAAATCLDRDSVAAELDRLLASGLLRGGSTVRLTPEGREYLAALIESERPTVDASTLAALYEEFDQHNTALKEIVQAWQLRGGEPNDHSDADHDSAVLGRLDVLHAGFIALVERIGGAAPRLACYPHRFSGALERIHAGETRYVARPIVDSYHTVWFEFHEELIGLLGLSREAEAAAGRAV